MKTILEDAAIAMPVQQAREKVAEYLRAVRDRHQAEDVAILRGYRALAKGHAVIDLPAVIRAGGVFEQSGLPRLAVATSSHQFVHVERNADGWCRFMNERWPARNRRKHIYTMPIGTLPEREMPQGNQGWRM
jgi:hypothetical protein